MQIEFLPLFSNVEEPAYATVGSAGFDIVANNFKRQYQSGNESFIEEEALRSVNVINLNPGDRALIGTGFSVAIPEGYVMDIRTRSGSALKEGLVVLNAPGTIDSDYRGEVGVIVKNEGKDRIKIKLGDKIAQGLILQFEVVIWKKVDQLPDTRRGAGGFGSTSKLTTPQSY
jgi:dUTP pyrophosphatase